VNCSLFEVKSCTAKLPLESRLEVCYWGLSVGPLLGLLTPSLNTVLLNDEFNCLHLTVSNAIFAHILMNAVFLKSGATMS